MSSAHANWFAKKKFTQNIIALRQCTDERKFLLVHCVNLHVCSVNNCIILKFRICSGIWKSQKSSLKSGIEIFIEIWKSCRNLRWNLEIMKSWNLDEILKSGWNLSRNPEIFSKVPRFWNLVHNFLQWPTPWESFYALSVVFCAGQLSCDRITGISEIGFTKGLKSGTENG